MVGAFSAAAAILFYLQSLYLLLPTYYTLLPTSCLLTFPFYLLTNFPPFLLLPSAL